MTKKRRNPRGQQPPVELVLLPDAPPPAGPPVPFPYDHIKALQQRLSLQGRRLVPGAPEGIRKIKIPSGYSPDGTVMWSDL